jgi:hypothetical protein
MPLIYLDWPPSWSTASWSTCPRWPLLALLAVAFAVYAAVPHNLQPFTARRQVRSPQP